MELQLILGISSKYSQNYFKKICSSFYQNIYINRKIPDFREFFFSQNFPQFLTSKLIPKLDVIRLRKTFA